MSSLESNRSESASEDAVVGSEIVGYECEGYNRVEVEELVVEWEKCA